jgi:hypothetical protein
MTTDQDVKDGKAIELGVRLALKAADQGLVRSHEGSLAEVSMPEVNVLLAGLTWVEDSAFWQALHRIVTSRGERLCVIDFAGPDPDRWQPPRSHAALQWVDQVCLVLAGPRDAPIPFRDHEPVVVRDNRGLPPSGGRTSLGEARAARR